MKLVVLAGLFMAFTGGLELDNFEGHPIQGMQQGVVDMEKQSTKESAFYISG